MKRIRQGIAIVAIMLGGPVAAQSMMPHSPAPPPVGGDADPNHSSEEMRTTRQAQDDASRTRDARNVTQKAKAVSAKPSDLTVGSKVSDIKGVPVGTIESVDADSAVVVTAAGKVKLGIDTFGKNQDGLLLAVTKAQFDAAVQAAVAKP